MGVYITAMGMMTPVGGGWRQTVTSVRAGISAYRESSIHNKRFQPMTLALFPDELLEPVSEEIAAENPGLTSRVRRILRLAAPALCEVLQDHEGDPLPLLLATPEDHPEHPAPDGDLLLDLLPQQAGVEIDWTNSKAFPFGRAAGIRAIEAAFERLQEGNEPLLVGGVDTHLDLYLLGILDRDDRVLADGVMDGFAPGEGAGFLLLESAEAPPESAFARLDAPALANEPGHRFSDEPYRGDGLADAVRATLAQHDDGPVQSVFIGLNGENFGAKEWGVAATRNATRFAPEPRFEHPADCYGDLGAATAPVLIGCAAYQLLNDHAPAPLLVSCSSEHESRGTVLLYDPT